MIWPSAMGKVLMRRQGWWWRDSHVVAAMVRRASISVREEGLKKIERQPLVSGLGLAYWRRLSGVVADIGGGIVPRGTEDGVRIVEWSLRD